MFKEESIKNILPNDERNAFYLRCQQLPTYQKELIQRVLDDVKFKQPVKNALDLLKTTGQFPEHLLAEYKEELIQRVLKNDAEFRRLITDAFDLRKIAEQFPEYAAELLKRVLVNRDLFKATIKDDNALQKIRQSDVLRNELDKLFEKQPVLSYADLVQALDIKRTKHAQNLACQMFYHSSGKIRRSTLSNVPAAVMVNDVIPLCGKR